MRTSCLALLLLSSLSLYVAAWTKDDHEIFRLRDEILQTEGDSVTFYDFVGVKPGASQDEITKAYRKKSKIVHPDKVKQAFIVSKAKPPPRKSGQKNKKPSVHVSKPPTESEIRDAVKRATAQYARLGTIAEILKGPGRERYDYFLTNGFPKWKGTGYYYARFRPGLGSVLAGLFVLGGGLAHYCALYLSWKRQKEFVERYIRHARKAAWGDDSGITGIPGIDGVATASSQAPAQEEGAFALNRRQKRQQERENRKEKDITKSKGGRPNGASTPMEINTAGGPQGARKKVQAENGKVLVVDSVGNVFLEEEDENGEKGEYLLDPNEIAKPTMRQTLLFRLPMWTFSSIRNRLTKQSLTTISQKDEAEVTPGDDSTSPDSKPLMNGATRKCGRRNG